ncbi:MAG: hypothetical protein L6R39_003461 [Caloplaca ligustica]|nr:MAG: hypothetical protein L6R39_003461 [Caloplaca ligustica]
MHRNDDFFDARDRRSPPRQRLAYRDSIDSFEGVMIPRRDHSREVYHPREAPVFDSDAYWRERSRSRSSRQSRGHHHRKYDNSDSDTDSIVSSDEEREISKARKKTLLAACLATVTTVAAGNNLYQSAKAHAAREKQLKNGELSEPDAQALKKTGRKLDLVSLGVAAVCLNNVKNGWKTMESQQQEARNMGDKHKKERRLRY